ncbi:hypothetical protein WJX77_011252 [Trebouxia sp. C0004]
MGQLSFWVIPCLWQLSECFASTIPHRISSKNKLVVESLQEFLPHKRSALTPSVTRSLKMKTGFNAAEIFRKFLWYLLRERKFDTEAVDDVVAAQVNLQLSDEEVSEAIQERAKRIYDKYSNIMLEVKGMTKAGVERKATCRALFSNLLYLAGELQSCHS